MKDTKIQQARVVRPVTWYGPENESIEDDDIHEAEQVSPLENCSLNKLLKTLTISLSVSARAN